MTGKPLTALLVLGLALTWVPASAAPPGNGQRKGDKQIEKRVKKASGKKTAPLFGLHDRDIISAYYRSSTLPPGLAKRGGELPPGLERQLERNGTLPPGLQKRIDPFPRKLARQLPPLPYGYTRGWIGGSAVIIDRRTQAIVDVIYNLLDSPGA